MDPHDEEQDFDEYDERQAKVDSIVRWGLVFAIFWLAGIGSIIAPRTIAASGGELIGSGRALACILVGAAGVLIWVPILIIAIVNQL